MFSMIKALSSNSRPHVQGVSQDSVVFLQQQLLLARADLTYITPEPGSETILKMPLLSESPAVY